ncbi:MAG: cupredoxin domain-containing protein [Dehalococcoidia bacterium]|jgi:plastocyanin|nr:cupredoxin domain-containing protein [Dehalococcoidia bacterium]
MKISASFLKLLAAAALLPLLLFAAAACGGGGPEELEIPVKLEHGKLSPETIRVKQDDMVTLKIDAEEPGELHLHGYDIEKEIAAGESVDFYFVAETTGRYQLTFHAGGAHGGTFESGPLEPGNTFTYEVEDHLVGTMVHFHSHMRPAVAGSITVSLDAPSAERVAIEIMDASAVPADIEVRPGTAITWTNKGSVLQTMLSGQHADAFVESEEEEPKAGFLEVLPR